MTARTAVSFIKMGESEPIFGAVWFSARVPTDRDTRMVKLLSINVNSAKSPEATPGKIVRLDTIIRNEFAAGRRDSHSIAFSP